jgi:two-component system response regulator AtoC
MVSKKILVIDDDNLVRWALGQKLAEWSYSFCEAGLGREGLRLAQAEGPDLVILDMKLPDAQGTDILEELKKIRPDLPVVMITAFGAIEDVVMAMRRGAYDFVTKPLDFAKLQSILSHALEAASLKKRIATYREIEEKRFSPDPMVGQTPIMRGLVDMIHKAAESEASIILLQGESGTGKDLAAQSIHSWSRRRMAPFLAINCSAIPENLLESELFGYEKGAFTDAKTQKRGLAELADEGTLFLDEISGLSLALQAKLLRFLETHSFRRIGGLRDIEVDLRVIVASNQDLDDLCRQEKFRRDLYYRLNVCPIRLPGLAERQDDILPLARHFVAHYNKKFNKNIRGLAKDVEKLFLNYPWPGNVRELKNAVERAMIFEEGSTITSRHLLFLANRPSLAPAAPASGRRAPDGLTLPEAEKEMVAQALKKSGGNTSEAARRLGVSRDTLRYKIKKMKLDAGS